VFASVAHGLITGLLFFVAGAIKDRYDTADLGQLTVLYGKVPLVGGVFAFAAMASLGLPGLAGFWGEMLAIRSAVEHAPMLPEDTFVTLAVVAAFGGILTTAYFLKVMRSMLQGPTLAPAVVSAAGGAPAASSAGSVPDMHALEWVVWSPLIALTLVLGVAPGLLLAPVADAAAAYFGGL
jgi:NADH-quinone oxidoreductase subunit M